MVPKWVVSQYLPTAEEKKATSSQSEYSLTANNNNSKSDISIHTNRGKFVVSNDRQKPANTCSMDVQVTRHCTN